MLTLCLFAPAVKAASAPALPIVVTGPAVQVGALTSGWQGSQSPLSGTFAIGANGDVYVGNGWGSNTYQMVPGGATTAILPISGSAATIDSYGNLYFGAYYSNNIYKIPYNAATGSYNYASFTSASYPSANCKGGTLDTAPCIFAPGVAMGNYADIAFDAQGNLFYAEGNTSGASQLNSIYECNLACIASTTGTPKLLYADSVTVGAMGVDPWGNIFFTDGKQSGVSNLQELPLNSGTYAAAPTTILSYTSTASWNSLTGVAVASNGTVYFGNNADGIYALPNTQSGGPSVAGMYLVSGIGGKAIALDSKGNLYQMNYNNGDVVSVIPANSLQLGASTLGGAATTVTANIIDNAASCTPTLTLTATEAGAPTAEFAAGTPSSCSAAHGTGNGSFSAGVTLNGAAFTVTLTFKPAKVGERSAAFTIADSANSAAGTITVSGVGQGGLANLDPGVQTAYTTGFNSPSSVVIDLAGDLFIADPGAGKVIEIPAGTTTPKSIGSFSIPRALVQDANGNLYVADSGTNQIDEIPNTFSGAQGGFTAGAQSVVVSSSAMFGGMALSGPNGLAIGPDGVLYITDAKNTRVVTFNPVNGMLGTTQAIGANGLKAPVGIAVDASNNLYVADTGAGSVFMFTPTAGFSTVTVGGSSPVSEPVGVAVEASGSLLIADKLTGAIVRVPVNSSGVPTASNAFLIEQNPQSAGSLFMDASGNIYTADMSGKAVYAIQRTAASVNFGTVSDGVSLSLPVTLMNAGNAAATLASPDYTAPTNPLFSIAPASTNGCGAGNGPAGASCQFIATFSPISGSTQQSGTATILISSPAGSATVNLTGLSTTSSILPQAITNFNPPTPILAGQQITLSATAGVSGNPVTYTIDGTSSCASCASINGNVLTATAAGSVIVDANELGGTVGGHQYSNAPTVKKNVTITSPTPAGMEGLVLTSPVSWSALPAGGTFAQDSGAGSSFGVNPQGNALVSTSYGGFIELFNVSTATWTQLGPYGKYGNTGGVTVDSAGNGYLGALYSGIVAKLPYNGGAYSTWATEPTGASTAPANCTATSTALCTAFSISGIGGVSSMIFDNKGNLFLADNDQGTPWTIWECTAACLASNGTSPAPLKLFQEPVSTDQINLGQLYLGSLAVDPWGNLFFTDSLMLNQSNNKNVSASSNLKELVYTAGTGYASTPVTIQTLAPTSQSGYNDELDAVAVNAAGTIYYGGKYDGIYAIPNTQTGGPNIAAQYVISNVQTSELAVDTAGDVYFLGPKIGEIQVNNVVVPSGQLFGAATSLAATVVDNINSCSKTANISIASSNSEFSGTATSSCTGISFGSGPLTTPLPSASTYPATINFAATGTGAQAATLTLSDTNNGGLGTGGATSTGLATPQVIAFTAPTNTTITYAPGLTVTLAATGGGSGKPVTFSIDAASTGAGTLNGAVLTVTQAGTIVIDANQVAGANGGTYYMAATQAQLNLTVNQAPQTLTFLAPLTPVTYAPGLQFALSATPGITGNPVTFTVDSSSTATATINVNVLTVTGAGTLVIDANEAGTVNYAAAAQQQQTVVVNQATQAITFVPPAAAIHYVPNPVASVCSAAGVGVNVNCNQITLVATGGASGKPVVFTIDKSSTSLGATISGTTLTFAAVGNVVVDANQVSTTNYLAAPQVQETIAILPALTTQTINFVNPGTLVAGNTFTLTATATSGLPVSYTAAPSTICTVSGSIVTAVAAGTCTVTALQPGDNAYFAMAAPVQQAFTVNPAGLIPNMTLSFSMADLVLQKGSVGVTQLIINSGNFFAGTVNFTCTGAPSGYTCGINPNPIFVPQSGSVATTISISPSTTSSLGSSHSRTYLPIGTLAVALCFFGLRKRNRLQLLLLAVVALAGFGLVTGCGGSSTPSATTGTQSTITVTATSGSVHQSITLSVLVQ
jgi:sugar lactone lactonase YvrE